MYCSKCKRGQKIKNKENINCYLVWFKTYEVFLDCLEVSSNRIKEKAFLGPILCTIDTFLNHYMTCLINSPPTHTSEQASIFSFVPF